MAEAALVSVSMGVMKPLLSKLTKLLTEELVKLKGVSKKIKFLKDELSAMSATLQMLADAEQLSPQMRLWRDKVRELTYDLEDCIDAFMARVDDGRHGPTGFKKYFRKLKRLQARHEIAKQIEELKGSVIEASERHKRYTPVEISSSSRSNFAVDPRLAALYVEIDQLVGIDVPKKHIIERLTMENSTELKVLSIVGCGGLGKTTLANQVYQSMKSQFSCAAFVSVSQKPDMKRILRDIAKQVDIRDNIMDYNEQQLIDELRKHLQEKRYLIVIDDIWDAKPWETIKLALVNKNCESRVITTTRSNDVASCLSCHGGYVYQMNPLSFEDSKRLLLKRAFGSENLSCTHLGSVPDEILRKCDGLPLAIITISSMLAGKHAKCEWDKMLNDIGSTLAKNPGAEKMTTILSLSYSDIPHHLRTCLLYLSVFPEDYMIEKQRLINRWIAEGFIHEEEGQTKYEIGEAYFNDLINRSMIQPIRVKYGQAEACRVHDIILDYIKYKATEENFITSSHAAEHVDTTEYKVRRLYLSNHTEENVTIWAEPLLSQVRSVTIFGKSVKTSLLPSTALRVLDLGNCWDIRDHHLASIENLFLLKYLRLSSRRITKLPEKIGELQYLQTLDVRGTHIEELPSTITKLQRLAHLHVDTFGLRFPDGMIAQMHSLEELTRYEVLSYEHAKSVQEFSKLKKLRTLEFGWPSVSLDHSEGLRQTEVCQSYVGTLLSSCNLYNLDIWDFFGNLYPLSLDSWNPAAPCSLRKLGINQFPIYKVPNWMVSLGNIVVLELNEILCLRTEDVEILGAIPSLLFLDLRTYGGSNRRIIVHGSNGFRNLKYFSLHIVYCGTALEFQVGSMPKLEHVKLVFRVHNRECLNGASSLGIQHLSALSMVEVQIWGECMDDSNYDPTEEQNDASTVNGAIRYIASAINGAIMKLPNRPTVKFEIVHNKWCEHFERSLWGLNRSRGGVFTEWLKHLQIVEEQTEQASGGESEQEDETNDEDKVEQTDEKEVVQQEGP